MADKLEQAPSFLGRRYDEKTDSWLFADGSGQITNMDREESIKGRDVVPLIDVWHLLSGHDHENA